MRRSKKWLALLLALCVSAPTAAGTLYSDVQIVQAAETGENAQCGTAITAMFTHDRDNQWIFTGGSAVAGGFAQTRGARNYVGLFEEFVRWNIQSQDPEDRQRFTLSTAKAELSLNDVAKEFAKYVSDYKTKAAVYMVCEEDYSKGTDVIDQFKTDLKTFIDGSLALKNGAGFAVIQKPFAVKDSTTNTTIKAYCDAVDAVVAEYASDADKYSHIVVVDHYTQTNNDDFKEKRLAEDGKTLNNLGHLEIAKELAAALGQDTSKFQVSDASFNKKEVTQPEEYSTVMPEVTATENSLKVTITGMTETAWKYEVQFDDLTVSGKASASTFEIKDLPAGEDYVLKIQTEDGKKQLVTTKGTVTKGEKAVKNAQTNLTKNQQKIAEMVAKDEPMTWLFMGDSITHAMTYTYGYDGIAQSFEKYVKEDLGRTNDVVLNTAVANATSLTTVEHLDVRLSNYDTDNNKPDVVSIMLGTNDCSSKTSLTPDTYRSNMKTILDKIKEINSEAVIILRSPTPVYNDAQREPYIDSYIAVMKELATEYDAIYVDQYTDLGEATSTYSWLIKPLFPDNLHPSAQGQRILTNQLIKACGIWTEDSTIGNLFYDWEITETTSALEPKLLYNESNIGVSVKTLESEYGTTLGDVTVKATSKDNGQTYEMTAKEGTDYAILSDLPANKTYSVEISGVHTGSAKRVTFAARDLTLSGEDKGTAYEVKLSSNTANSTEAGTEVGNLTIGGIDIDDTYTYSVTGENAALFEVVDGKLKVKAALTEGEVYTITVKASDGTNEITRTFEIKTRKKIQLIDEEVKVTSGTYKDLTNESYASELLTMEEGTIVVSYTSTGSSIVQTLFSASNGTSGNANRHFQLYVNPSGKRVGAEIRNDSGLNYHIYADNVTLNEENTVIAFKADKENNEYKIFVNGTCVATKTDSAYQFVNNITGVDTLWLGATKRNEAIQYQFEGTIHSAEYYNVALSDREIKELTTLTNEKTEVPSVPMDTELPKAGSISADEITITNDQPFASGTAGSNRFRIPALITLNNGDLLAAADARWDTNNDSNGLDTIASVSKDNGKTWNYSFPIYFPDSEGSTSDNKIVTTAIDPVIVQGNDGKIYCIADMNPSGITTGAIMPSTGTGFVKINGTDRLVLTDTYVQPTSNNWSTYGDPENAEEYAYYVGDFKDGYAPVLNRADHTKTTWCVDEWYNIYQVDENGKPNAKLTQKQVNADNDIQQNVFYKDSVLHVFSTGYLWLVTSTDNGMSWENPQILNTQIKRTTGNYGIDGIDVALLASPGQGICTSEGDIVIPFYDHNRSGESNYGEHVSVVWSSDQGATWHRSNDVNINSSESEIVELNNGVLRIFYRNYTGYICYADITKDTDGNYVMGEGVKTNIGVCSTCNVTAINTNKTVDGKKVIMVACPGGSGRNNGKIYSFLVADDNTMELYQTYSINEGYYAYSCMTQMTDGTLGLLWEDAAANIRFDVFDADVVLGSKEIAAVDPGESYVSEIVTENEVEITEEPDSKIATIAIEVVEEQKVTLHDHGSSGTANKTDWFDNSASSASIQNAEFTFTGSGETWQIYNESQKTYLGNQSNAGSYFQGSAVDMKVVAVDGNAGKEFRISKTDGTRYIMFYYPQMNFNGNSGSYNEGYADGSQELVLLEKQAVVSADDILPGYKRAAGLTSGNKYLITYMTAENDIILLYPTNGQNAQTKLVGDITNVKKNVITIKGIAEGRTQAVINGIVYEIVVGNPPEETKPVVEGVTRLAGGGRLETSRKVATALKETLGIEKFETIVVATSKDPYDALAGSYLAIEKDAPILLTNSKEAANADLLAYVNANAKSGAKIYILGGTNAVSADVKNMFTEAGYDVEQLDGQTRLDTNKMILDAAGLEGQKELVVVTSKGFADSLSASATGRPILLVNPDKALNADQKAVLDHFKNGKVYIIGGESAVSEACKADIEAYLGAEITRVAGDGRYITSVEVAKTFFADAEYAVVATGNDFPDGLCGGPLAAALNAPLLLTRDGNTKAADYAKTSGITSGYVLGGDQALADDTVKTVFSTDNITVK